MKHFTPAVLLLLAAPFAAGQPPLDIKAGDPPPDVAKADPKSDLTALNKEKTFYLEKKPDGTKRVLFVAQVCRREGPLEVFLCKQNTKEHEAILRTDIPPQLIHAALVAAGGEVGKPVQFVDPKTGNPAYKPATGSTISVKVHHKKDGKELTSTAQEWITELKTKKPMAHEWVFAGSRFVKNPEKPDEPDYYCANNGEMIGISNFPDSTLDLPVEVGDSDAELAFAANTDKIPPLASKVWVILEVVPKPAAKPGEKKEDKKK